MSEKPILYHDPRSRGATTAWMDEELGGVCDIRLVDLRAGGARTPAFLNINPMGKIPALTHNGAIVTEAAAICAYLADAFAERGLAPPTGDPARGAYYRWLFFSPSVIEPMMLDKLGGVTRENAVAAGHGDPERVMRTIDVALHAGPWLLGEKFSAADVVFGSTLNFATQFGAIEKTGAIGEYVERLSTRDAFRRSEEKNAAWRRQLEASQAR